MNEVISISFDVRYKITHAIDRKSLGDQFHGNILEYIKWQIEAEGIEGIVADEYEILSAEEV